MTEKTENRKKERYLTTTQAAEILQVSADTVLKWVRAGKLRSYKTLGGHFRIPISTLDSSFPGYFGVEAGAVERKTLFSYQYCWEFFARDKDMNPECRDCITFRSGSKRCYELRDLPEGFGCLGVYCKSECRECEYYRLVKEQGLNVLLVAKGKTLVAGEDRVDGMQIRVVHSEYECAVALEKFRPDCVVVDCGFGKGRTRELCQSLFDDARLPVIRIVLASRSEQVQEYCDKQIFGWIRKPFSAVQLKECIKGV